jgi:hypothetical protein
MFRIIKKLRSVFGLSRIFALSVPTGNIFDPLITAAD